nr:hypothetical protein [Tanacetum cinerariifolium]
TEYQLADMFAKALLEDRFKYLVRRIDLSENPVDQTDYRSKISFFIIPVQTPGSGISILLAVGTPSTGSGNLYCQWELSPGSGNALCILFPTRPFLRTARALINAHGEEMILRDGDERLTLNMRNDTSSYSNQPYKESINMINIYNDSYEDYLEDLFATNHLMKMEILLEPTSNKLLVVMRTRKHGNSNTSVLEDPTL